MKHLFATFLLLPFVFSAFAQNGVIQGQLQDAEANPVGFANVLLYNSNDSTLHKVETSNETGIFKFQNIKSGNYYLLATYVGFDDLKKDNLQLLDNQSLDLGVLKFGAAAVELTEATVTASRALVEVKPDRTVFNVDGTINSTGDDAVSLLRKAPGVMVDNNDNINVLGRSGVLVYVDGKRLPLSGQDLSNYLQNLRAEQIDRIDIITNPGAKYEAEGNAGIIDIRLKKNKSFGTNGTLTLNASQGRYGIGNVGGSFNYRNKKLNVFGSADGSSGEAYNFLEFHSLQNGLILDEILDNQRNWNGYNFRFGTDFFINEKNTIGFLASGGTNWSDIRILNQIGIADGGTATLDSVLIANGEVDNNRTNLTFNVNYRFEDKKKQQSLNIDLDYGNYGSELFRYLPNRYYDPTLENLLTEVINRFETPSDIGIYTFKLDFEDDLWGGKIGLGTKWSNVISDNTFLFFDEENGVSVRNDSLSNLFKYDENVYAGYVSYSRALNKKWNFSAGLRVEKTDARGDLQAFLPQLAEPPVDLNYWSWFPSAGLTWQVAEKHALALNYGRRINRPDYNVLNPFNNRLSEISYEKGNPFLRPEIVNNLELGYTFAYMYNFKIGYSYTTDQITRLIGPDENDDRANFITWENLAEQTIWSANLSAPIQLTKWWNAYISLSGSHINNQAFYGEGAVVDVQTFTYNFYQQHTFDLPMGFKGEISGWYSGPGVWGGVFLYESSWSLNVGLQRKFLQDKLNVRLSFNDIFYESGWDGYSLFNGLYSEGGGNWDSRRGSISISYNFGNQNVKSRKRKTGLESEAERVGQ